MPVLRSFLVRDTEGQPTKVGIQPPENGFCFVAARRGNPRMEPCKWAFEQLAVSSVHQLKSCSSPWVGIDEIGYLEEFVPCFQQAILQLFENKRVIAVLRKEYTPFLQQLFSRPDCLVVDLDILIQSQKIV